jgi:GNAT superfamily N-acetyltransferase
MTSITVTTEVVTESLLAEVASLYAAEYYKTQLWAWQFAPRFGQEIKCIVARDNGVVIGFNATMPIELIDEDDQLHKAIWSCDFIVAPAYRGKGIGQAIKDEMARSFTVPIMSLGISDRAFPLLLKKGWSSPAKLYAWDLLLRPHTFKQLILMVWSKVFRLYYYFSIRRASKKYSAEEINDLPDPIVIEHLWKLYRSAGKNVEIYRHFPYLKWRYGDCPFPVYHFLHIGCAAEGAKALIVFRVTAGERIDVVDFIGAPLPEIVTAATGYWLKRYPEANAVQWNNFIPLLRQGLITNGFFKKSYGSRFATHSAYKDSQWCLVAGDSDGDFLCVAKEESGSKKSRLAGYFARDTNKVFENKAETIGKKIYTCAKGFNFHALTEAEFFSCETIWNQLLNQSNANPLFMGWQWTTHWWALWGDALSLQLSVIFIFKDDQLVGILPLYKYRKAIHECYQFLGNAWGLSPTIRSEYTSPIFLLAEEANLYQSLALFIKNKNFNTSFIFSDATFNHMPGLSCWKHRDDMGYRTKVMGSFESYVESLGRMTRLKAFHRRAYLAKFYDDLKLEPVNISRESITNFFNHLNSFHLLRWGKPCFDKNAQEFHTRLLLGPLGKNAILSYLCIDGEIVSASYNLKQGNVIYNIQSGYLENFDKKVSLGTLHMGWLIEQAFADNEVVYFDFLAGFGRTQDYKKHYRGEIVHFYTFQYFSNAFFGSYVFFILKIKWAVKNSVGKLRAFLKGIIT